jgi:crotonobetainyl-CoA:carnitine CoA-transferase CaiB-like acyl-CoA transferase
MAFQAGEFIFYDGRPDMENGAAEYRGRSALGRAYQCRDQEWLFISVVDERGWKALRAVLPALANLSWQDASREPNEGKLAASIAEEFAKLDRADALATLAKNGVAASVVNHFKDLFDDPQVAANELIAELPHSVWGRVKQTGMLTKFSATPGVIERAGPALGEHTEQVLREMLGYPSEKIADLRASRIVH